MTTSLTNSVHQKTGTMEQELAKRRNIENKRQQMERREANSKQAREQDQKENRDRKSADRDEEKDRQKNRKDAKDREQAYVNREQIKAQQHLDKYKVREDAMDDFNIDEARGQQKNLMEQVNNSIVMGPVFERDFISEGTDMINRVSQQG